MHYSPSLLVSSNGFGSFLDVVRPFLLMSNWSSFPFHCPLANSLGHPILLHDCTSGIPFCSESLLSLSAVSHKTLCVFQSSGARSHC